MAGVNKVIIVGYLGNDPDMRAMTNGDAVATLSIATSEEWTDKQTQEKKSITEWHRVVFFRRQAEICGQYLRKGSQVYIEGRLRTRKWQDKNGQDRYTTEINGDVLQMLGSKSSNAPSGMDAPIPESTPYNQAPSSKPAGTTTQAPQIPEVNDLNDDIPF